MVGGEICFSFVQQEVTMKHGLKKISAINDFTPLAVTYGKKKIREIAVTWCVLHVKISALLFQRVPVICMCLGSSCRLFA